MFTRRSRAREVALQLLFQRDQNPTPVARPDVERFVRDRLLDDGELAEFCLSLLDGVVEKQAELDQRISAAAENWRIGRMLPVDRNVLRLGAYELTVVGTPREVAIDEAIELSRRFGSKDSASFVNGVLDKVAQSKGA
jgi:N utilization substance protein B